MKIYFLSFTFLLYYLKPSFEELGIEFRNHAKKEPSFEELKAEIEEFKPDLIIRTALFVDNKKVKVYKEITEWAKTKGITTAFWNIEDPNHCHSFIEQCKGVDVLFTSASECVPFYKREGFKNIEVVPLAVAPKVHHPIEAKQEYDIVFAGNWYPYADRIIGYSQVLKHLLKSPKYKDRVKIWGYKDKWLENGVPEENLMGYIGITRLNDVYCKAKIVLGINEQRFSPTMTSMRTYEVLGCKAFHLSAWSLAMENIFEDRKHLVLSASKEETFEFIEGVLDEVIELFPSEYIHIGGDEANKEIGRAHV